jgi:signal transduction histidine kinase
VTLVQRRVPLALVLVGFGLLLASFAGILLLLRFRQTHDMRAVVRGLTGQAGVIELDHRGRVRHANPKSRELLQLAGASETAPFAGALAPLGKPARDGSVPRELPLSLPTGQTILARATSVKARTLLTLEDISAVEYMRRVTAWAPVAQKLAHDIKNPLSTIRLKAQQMEEDGVTGARTIQEEVDRLSRMTDGFARLANFEPLKLEPKDINMLVRRVVEEQGLSLRSGLVVRLDLQADLPLLNLDEEQMARALANLVTNAVAVMPGTGVLTVRTRTMKDGTHVALGVADTGPGIPEEYRSKLFQPFFTRTQGGTGLGLTIARKVAEDHGGTIEVESELGKGSTLSIVLPAGKAVGIGSA